MAESGGNLNHRIMVMTDDYVLDTTVTAGGWLATGTPSLDYWYLTNAINTCCGKAKVEQSLEYRYYFVPFQEVIWPGVWTIHEF